MRINLFGKAFRMCKRLLKVFNTIYCKMLGNNSCKIRKEWIQAQAARVPNDSKVLLVGAESSSYHNNFFHCSCITQNFLQKSNLANGENDSDSCYIIPEETENYDVVLYSEGNELIFSPITVLHEISRILKTGGKLIFTASFGRNQKPFYFYGSYSKLWYENIFPKLGLDIEFLDPYVGLFGHAVELLWRGNNIVHEIRQRGLPGKILASLVQFFCFNVPTIILAEFERKILKEDYALEFLCIAKKIDNSYEKIFT